MALLILGSTKCTLCGKVIDETHKHQSFRAFIPPGHRLHQFSDASFHHSCLTFCAEYQELMDLLDDYLIIFRQRPLPTAEVAKQFDAWYNNSEAIRSREAKLDKFWSDHP